MKPKKAGSTRMVSSGRSEVNPKSQVAVAANGAENQQQSTIATTCGTTTQTTRGGIGGSSSKSFAYTCAGCSKPIKKDKFLLKACDKYWHENCLRCDRCHSRLGELGSTLFCKSNMNLCRQDYLEMFGETGICSVCEKLICASEMVMRAKMNVYHLECFACQLCNQRFCVGDRFYLCENKVVCQYDYDEHILPIQRSMFHQRSAELELYSSHHPDLSQAPPLAHLQPQQQQQQQQPPPPPPPPSQSLQKMIGNVEQVEQQECFVTQMSADNNLLPAKIAIPIGALMAQEESQVIVASGSIKQQQQQQRPDSSSTGDSSPPTSEKEEVERRSDVEPEIGYPVDGATSSEAD